MLSVKCDIIVVGCAIGGCLLSYQLLSEGFIVVVMKCPTSSFRILSLAILSKAQRWSRGHAIAKKYRTSWRGRYARISHNESCTVSFTIRVTWLILILKANSHIYFSFFVTYFSFVECDLHPEKVLSDYFLMETDPFHASGGRCRLLQLPPPPSPMIMQAAYSHTICKI